MTCRFKTPYHKPYTKKRTYTHRLAFLSLSILLSSLVGGLSPRWAQAEDAAIVVDPSLGDERSQVVPDSRRSNRTNVTGGAQRGSNLFHSFERFNILDSQQSVYFVPDSAIENVLTRVVGNDPSNILGTLGVEGSANLWLINPNGILFGEDAILDVTGAFYATTGDAIALGNGTFNAINPEDSQLLSVPPETSFANYLTADSGAIVSQADRLSREVDANLTLAGGEITLETGLRLRGGGTLSLLAYNTIETNRLNAKGTDIRFEALNGSVTADAINTNVTDGSRAGNVDITAAGNVRTNSFNTSSTNNRDVDSDMSQGGSITIETTGRGNIFNAGSLNTQSRSQNRDAGDGGDISLQATGGGDITNEGFVRSQSDAVQGNTGAGGAITMTTAAGNILNRDIIRSQTNILEGNAGRGGDITLTATDGSITNEREISTQSKSDLGRSNNGGDIFIIASGDINNQQLNTFSSSQVGVAQDGGNIEIHSTGGGNVTNRNTLRSLSLANGGNAGNGGSVEISVVDNGNITNDGAINAQSLSNRAGNTGRGGNITLTSENGNIVGSPGVSFNGGSLNTRSVTREGIAGNAGNIEITSTGGDIVLNDYLDAKSYSLNGRSRDGGNITIEARQGSIIGDAVPGRSTNIITSAVSSLDAQSSSSQDNSLLGDSGTVTITAGDRLSGFNIFTLSNLSESGDVSIEGLSDFKIDNVQIITNEETIVGGFSFDENPLFPSNLPGGAVDTSEPIVVTQPQSGLPGNVLITSNGSLITNNVQIISDANSPSDATMPVDAGNIEITAATTAILDNTLLITRTNGESRAGNIFVESGDYLLLRNGTLLLADAEQDEDGGTIRIRSSRVIASPDGNNDIITNASNGNGGEVFSPNATLYGFEVQNGLTTTQLRNSRSNDVSTRSEFGQDGSITINAITETPNQTQSEELDDSFATPEQLISNSCISPNSSVAGRFTIPGTGDLPPTPEDSTASVYGVGDVQTLSSGAASSGTASNTNLPSTDASLDENRSATNATKQAWQLGDPIVEPESIGRLADGRIVFGQSCSAL